MKHVILMGALIALVIWNAYRVRDASDFLFPKDGETLTYTVRVTANSGISGEGRATLRHSGAEDIDEKEYQRFVLNIPDVPALKRNTVYSRAGKDGIYSRASTKLRFPEYLELPYPPTVGYKWTYEHEGNTAEKEIVAIEPLALPDNKVYQNCVKVRSKAKVEGHEVESLAYFAPRVGLVKQTVKLPDGIIELTLKGG